MSGLDAILSLDDAEQGLLEVGIQNVSGLQGYTVDLENNKALE
jgi:hypothetical protein